MKIFCLMLSLVLFSHNISIAQVNKERKDPAQAFLLSVLWPGIGQFYVRDPIKGTIMAVGQTVFLVAYIDAISASKTEKYGDTQATRAGLLLCFMIGNVIYSAVDAGNTARALNDGEGLSLQLDKSNYLPNSIGKNISNDICAKILFRVRL